MEESFLHFIWKFQHFERQDILTDSGLRVSVFEPGHKNSDAGPDFKNARIRIGEIVWSGHVEIHVNASDWNRHRHQDDPAYNNVILHVVWKNDSESRAQDGNAIPVLELKNRIPHSLLARYRALLTPETEILCAGQIGNVRQITVYNMIDQALARRLQTRAQAIFREIGLTNQDWEEIAWRMLAKNFGFKTNAETFLHLAKSIPVKILKKESHDLIAIEALLFGMAGFLDGQPVDEYQERLTREYVFKSKKYNLEQRLSRHHWKFLRLRPPNFPTIRIAQLAGFVAGNSGLFTLFIDQVKSPDHLKLLAMSQSEYWHRHYDFGLKSKVSIGQLGRQSIENIVINTIAPLLFAYGWHQDNEQMKEDAAQLLTLLKPEKNSIISKWQSAGVKAKSAFDTQALIEQFNQFCIKKQCLNCPVGVEIIRS